MTQYFTPGALSPTDLYDSPATSRATGTTPAVHVVPPAPPAHLKHTPHKLGKAASTPCKSRRQAPGAPKISRVEHRYSKNSQPVRSSRDQAEHASSATPLADITAGAQVSASPAQCIADMPSTAAALQRLKQTRSHGRVRSVPAPPPHLQHQLSSSSSPPLTNHVSDAATTSLEKALAHTSTPRSASKSKKQAQAKGTPVALSPVPHHLSKRSERSRRTGTHLDPRTILSTRGKRPTSAADQRAAYDAAVAKHTLEVAQVAAMQAAAVNHAQSAALHQQIQQMTSTGRPPAPANSTAQPLALARSKSASQTPSRTSRMPQGGLQHTGSVPDPAARLARRQATSPSVETGRASGSTPSPPHAGAPAHHPRGDGNPAVHGATHVQDSPIALLAATSVIDLTGSPSPPLQCASPSMNASPTLPLQPSDAAADSGRLPTAGTTPARPAGTQSLDRSVPAPRPPTAPATGRPRRVPTKDFAVPALQSSSSSGSVSTSEPQRAAGQSSAVRTRDRTPSKPSARRRKSPSQIVHAIQNAGQARTRPTQSATDTSDPRLRGQAPVAAAAPLPEEQKQVELDSVLRRLQPPRFSSDVDNMSGSDDEDVDMHVNRQDEMQACSYKLPRHSSEAEHSIEFACVSQLQSAGRTQEASISELLPVSGAGSGSADADREAPPVMESLLSLQQLMQTCPAVRQRRSERQLVTEGWMHERSLELGCLEESMQVLALGGRSSSGMSADVPLRGGVLRTGSSSQMDSGALSKSVDQFLLAERAAAMAAAAAGGQVGDEMSGRTADAAERQRGRVAGATQRRALSRSPLPRDALRSYSPEPARRGGAGTAAGSSTRADAALRGDVARPHTVTGPSAGPPSVHGGGAGPSAAAAEAVGAAASSRRKGGDEGVAIAQGPAGSKVSGLSPYMASPMAQKAPPKTKSTVGALRTPSVQPRAAMMACQRKRP